MTQPTLLPRRRVGPLLALTWLTLVGVAILCGAGGGVERLRAQSPAALVFDGVTVVDVEHGRLLRDQRVVIVGNRIRSMGSARTTRVPAGAQIVAAQGKYLIPGLWDMHVHLFRSSNILYPLIIAQGVTGIGDRAAMVPLDTLRLWRSEILAGTRVGPPRQLFAGPRISSSSDTSECHHPAAEAVCINDHDTSAARSIVDSLKAAGANMIKTYDLSRELYFVIAAEARRIGIPFGGHAEQETALEASDSGARILDHPNSAGDLDTLCVGSSMKNSTPSVARCQPVAERFRRNNTWWCPTLAVVKYAMDSQLLQASTPIFTRFQQVIHAFWSGAAVRPGWLRDSARATASPRAGLADTLPNPSGYLSIVHRAGLPILAGTDGGGRNPGQANKPYFLVLPLGFSLQVELAIYVAEGLTPLEALQAATLNPARAFHMTDSLGTVAPGKLADLVLLDANPLRDITNTTLIRAVVANGRYFDRAALDRLLDDGRALGLKSFEQDPIPPRFRW